MLKKQNGITLITVVITFLVLLVIVGVGYSAYRIGLDQGKENNQALNANDIRNIIASEIDNRITEPSSNTTPTNTNKPSNVVEKDIYEKLLNGDFSGVAGEYVNSEGKTITLLSNGLCKTDKEGAKTGFITKLNDGTYKWSVSDSEGSFEPNTSAYQILVYPAGFSVKYHDSETTNTQDDTSKIRLQFNPNAAPKANEVYTKK